jgi:hypothetical protein
MHMLLAALDLGFLANYLMLFVCAGCMLFLAFGLWLSVVVRWPGQQVQYAPPAASSPLRTTAAAHCRHRQPASSQH